ncbi:OVCH1-like protein [Mya arenaria]|uniref:OVCH1-like protein n=1 Tax=Mya arenaria TaxID=6604 RepID=A0ABY7DJ36_MYAAR|nr:OVCH1-like protein [Mya arenaria]
MFFMVTDSSNSTCGVPEVAPSLMSHRIVGGREAVAHSWPWVVSLAVNGYHQCGGAIVHPLWIITAAHCFEANRHTLEWTVVAGKHQKTKPENGTQTRAAERIVVNSGYNYITTENDIALVRLQEPLTFNSHVQAVCLPVRPPTDGESGVVAGWGEVLGTCCPEVLKQVELPVVPRATCTQSDHLGPQVTANMFCAGYEAGGEDACQVSSGGEVACQVSYVAVTGQKGRMRVRLVQEGKLRVRLVMCRLRGRRGECVSGTRQDGEDACLVSSVPGTRQKGEDACLVSSVPGTRQKGEDACLVSSVSGTRLKGEDACQKGEDACQVSCVPGMKQEGRMRVRLVVCRVRGRREDACQVSCVPGMKQEGRMRVRLVVCRVRGRRGGCVSGKLCAGYEAGGEDACQVSSVPGTRQDVEDACQASSVPGTRQEGRMRFRLVLCRVRGRMGRMRVRLVLCRGRGRKGGCVSGGEDACQVSSVSGTRQKGEDACQASSVSGTRQKGEDACQVSSVSGTRQKREDACQHPNLPGTNEAVNYERQRRR